MNSILFLDRAIADYQSLLEGLNPETQLVILDPNQDGILQITDALKSGVFNSVHIVSHGTAGNLKLGTTQLNASTLPTYSNLLQQWSNNLTPGADILIYGCNVAQGQVGQEFVQQLHQLTGADIAASDDATGSVVLGGNWNLEYSTGNITAPLAFQVGVMEAYNSVLAPFTAGNLVVLQVGTGSAALSGAATAVFLKEFNTTNTAQTGVQSIALPTAVSGNNRILTQSGTAGSEGALNLSTDGKFLTLVGYDAAPGTAAVTSTTSAATNRIVARVDASGTVDTSTRISGAYSGNNIRSAVTNDGTGFWVAGPSTGLTYVSYGSTGAATALNALNSRVINIFNGQLYTSSASGSNIGINTVGSGLPTSVSQTVTLLPGATATNAYSYVLLDRDAGVAGLDTLYIADQTAGLLKYSFNGTTWTARGSIAGTLTGLTGVINGSNVDLYATNGTTAGNSLVKVTDTAAFSANLSGSFTTLATAPTNTIFKGVAFAPVSSAPTKPTVNLSVSNTAGSETGQTSITVTVRASANVTNAETVTLTVSGTNITTGDYTLNNTTTNTVTITIPSGQDTGTATFKVVDDSLVEGDETAVLTISNPSSGITLGSTVSQNITITDNDFPLGATPTIQENTASTLLNLAATGSGMVSGVINDPTDPAQTLGIDFTIADTDTPVGNLSVTVASSNQNVVTNASLTASLTGTGATRNLKITPINVGLADIIVTVSDSTSSSTYTINYAASAASVNPTTTRFFTGAANASTAIAIGSNYVLVGDDEDQTLRLYDRTKSGLPVNSFDFTSSLGLTDLSGGVPREVDIEASAKLNNRIFWMGSESNNDSGANRPNRNRIFATDISGTDASTTLSYVGRYDYLRDDIIAWDVNNGHGLGANFFGLSASAASGIGSKLTNGYNIEGLEFAPDNTTAYVAFRAPQEPTAGRTNALIIPVTNFASLIGNPNSGSATFGAPIQLDLDGRGIREIRKNANNQYVIIAGPAGDATGTAPSDFRLYTWTGQASDAPILRSANLTAFSVGGSFESIVAVPDNLTDSSQLQLLVDNGTTVFYNNGVAGSDMPTTPNFQKSRSEIVTLGTPVLPVITKISAIQGSGATAALTGIQTIEGIVTRTFLGATKLNGFYVQEEDADSDGNAATSEAIFVSDTAGLFTGNIGDKVRITGTAGELASGTSSSLTQLSSLTKVINLGASALPTVTNIQLPVTSVADLERYEGMLVNISAATGNLTVTENYQLGRYGQVVLAVDGASNQAGTDARLDQYTQFNAPSVGGYTAYQAELAKRRIYLDDGSSTSNPDPTLFARGGNPLSATNTLRSGDTVANITGILDERFEGYRIQTSTGVNFNSTNARPDTPPAVGGTLKVSSFNVLNYFNDLNTGASITAPNGVSFVPRGANTTIEFTRQRDKIIQAIIASGADVIGLMEMENNGFGPNSAIQDLVNGLNTSAGAGTYAFITPPNRLGTDAINVGLIYKPSKVTPVGAAAAIPDAYGTGSFDVVGRKPLAQTFQQNATGEQFTAVVNHFKSKGSSSGGTGDADAGDGQGLSNGTRTRQAQDLATWLATKPTGSNDPDYILLGDFNAYAKEDPLTTLDAAGYRNLLANTSYSYVFDGQVGALDHALGSSALASQVTGADKWHINADEPVVLDYNTEFKTASQVSSLYGVSPFRSSDHDPVLVGLNLNSAPTNIALSATATNENVAANSAIATLSTTDPTIGDTFTYSFVGGSNDNAAFTISGNQLLIKASPDYETKSSYNIVVRSTDNGGLYTDKNFTLTVTDVNEAPTAVNLGNVVSAIAENTSTTTRIKVANVNITDDALGTNNLSVSGSDASFFEVDATGLYIKAGTVLNYEAKTSYNVTVNVDDPNVGNTPDATTNFTLNVTDVNEAPVLNSALASQSVNNGSTFNYVFGANTFTDPEGIALTYSITGQPSWLTFNSNTRTFGGTANGVGTSTITVSASDGVNATSSSFALIVNQPVVTTTVVNQSNATSGQTILGTAASENIFGSNFNDLVKAGDGNDIIDGNAGNDRLYGEGGDDTLVGGFGTDNLYGGLGSDIFIVQPSSYGLDLVNDFQDGIDFIGLSDTYSGGLTFNSLTFTAFGTGGVSTSIRNNGTEIMRLINVAPNLITNADFKIINDGN